MSTPTACGRCGSSRIRHARSHNLVHRAIRAWTDWDRYACGTCGHRGWRQGKLPRGEHQEAPRAAVAGGRRAERRDRRLKRRQWLRLAVTVAIGLALGYLAAKFVLRLGALQPPPPE